MRKLGLLLMSILFLESCEEVIHVDLNTSEPRYVIEADLLSGIERQTIRVTQTVAFDNEEPSKPIDHAYVQVESSTGHIYSFYSIGNGYYVNERFNPRAKLSYQLLVRVDEQDFQSVERMHDFVHVDSVGIIEENIFKKTHYSVLLKFHEPAEEENYYKYSVSVNGTPFRFLQVQSDKYNNGLYITHQLMDYRDPFELGDSLVIRRQSVSQAVFKYWNEIQRMNPTSAAPSNPTSNISNGALGYFSVSAFKDFAVHIHMIPQVSTENE